MAENVPPSRSSPPTSPPFRTFRKAAAKVTGVSHAFSRPPKRPKEPPSPEGAAPPPPSPPQSPGGVDYGAPETPVRVPPRRPRLCVGRGGVALWGGHRSPFAGPSRRGRPSRARRLRNVRNLRGRRRRPGRGRSRPRDRGRSRGREGLGPRLPDRPALPLQLTETPTSRASRPRHLGCNHGARRPRRQMGGTHTDSERFLDSCSTGWAVSPATSSGAAGRGLGRSLLKFECLGNLPHEDG